MKSAATITLLIGAAAAFAPSMTTLPAMMRPTSSQFVLFADPKEEEGGLDLNLEEMFDMYVKTLLKNNCTNPKMYSLAYYYGTIII